MSVRTAPIPRWLPYAALLLCATLWSLNGPLVKLLCRPEPIAAGDGAASASAPGVSALAIACYRSLIGGVLFVPWAARRARTLGRVRWPWPVAAVACFTLMTVTFVIATAQTAAASAIVLQYTSPVWVFLLSALLLRERPTRIELLVLAVALVGVGIIFAGNPAGELRWLIVALVSGVGYGALTVVLRGLRPVHALVVAGLVTLGSGLALAAPLAIWGTFVVTPRQAALLLLMSAVQFAAPYLLFTWALQHVPAPRAALLTLLETVLNPLLTWLIVGQPVPTGTLVGGPLIILAAAGGLVRQSTRQPPVPPGD